MFDIVSRSEIPTDVAGVVMLIHFLIAVYISGRVDERIQRLQFLWTQEVKTEFSRPQSSHSRCITYRCTYLTEKLIYLFIYLSAEH